MQSENERIQIVHSTKFDDREQLEQNLVVEMKNAVSKGAVSHVIGNIPEKGDIVEIYGLKYKVKNYDSRCGILKLKML